MPTDDQPQALRDCVIGILLSKWDLANGVLPGHNKGAVLSVPEELRRLSDRCEKETGLALDDSATQDELKDVLDELDEALDCVRKRGTDSAALSLFALSPHNRTLAMLGLVLIRQHEQR